MPKTSLRALVFFTLLAAVFFLKIGDSQAQSCTLSSGTLTCDGTNGDDSFDIGECSFPAPGCLGVGGTDYSPVFAAFMNGLGGNDDFSLHTGLTFLVNTPIPPIYIDGGPGTDNLFMGGFPDITVDNTVYDPGPGLSDGRVKYTQNNLIVPLFELQFVNLESSGDSTATTNLIVNGTTGDNAINYFHGDDPLVFGIGTVSVDGFLPFVFNNKSVLVLDGRAGQDTFNLNNQNANPPSGITQIQVKGGDPTSGDTVIVNGKAGTDTIHVQPTGIDSATVTGLQAVPINISTSEKLIIDGQGGQDHLFFDAGSGDQTFTLNVGDDVDNGSVQTQDNGLSVNFLSLEYKNLGTLGFVIFDGGGGNNTLVMRTTDQDDEVTVQNFGPNQVEIDLVTGTKNYLPVFTANVSFYLVQTLQGDDTVFAQVIGGNLGRLELEGGGSNGDHLFFEGGTGDIQLDLIKHNLSGPGFLMGYQGFADGNIDVQNFGLTANGGVESETFRYRPLSATDGVFELIGQNMPWHFFGAASVTFDGMGGSSDDLIVEGTPRNDTVTVHSAAPQVTIAGLLPASILNMEILTVDGLGGDDTFNATGLASTSVVLDGGPHATGDTLNFDGQRFAVSATSSSFTTTGLKPVSYFNMENVNATDSVFSPPPPGGTVQLNAAVFRNLENDGIAVISAERTGDGIGQVSVDFATSDGTAKAGTDYTSASGTLNWANGETGEKTFQVPLIDNDKPDGTRTLNLTLDNLVAGDGAVLGTPIQASLIISDDETAPVTPPDSSGGNSNGGGCRLNPGSSFPVGSGLFGIFLMALAGLFVLRMGRDGS